MPHTRCPSCHSDRLESLYEVRGVPTHSCLLMETREQAIAYPTGDVTLAFCLGCGFGTNTRFDVSHNDYSTAYEEVQTCSPTFREFSGRLVEHLVRKRGMRDVDVVEIGCGKGEFLKELCEAGGNRGVGIDPSFIPGRGEFDDDGRVRFLPELYSPQRHGGLPADLVVCRHTLEHIHPTADLVRNVRASLSSTDTLVFFELPDQERVYDECAFWDVYYEHCSYFTGGSLARLFLANGFEVIDLWKDYGDQYLLIEARPLAEGKTAGHRIEENLEDMTRRARDFSQRMPGVLEAWRSRFREWAGAGKRTAIWGAGSKGVAFLTSLDVTDEVAFAIDINPRKQGCYMPGSGHAVVAPESLPATPPDVVVRMNEIYRDEVREQLAGMGLHPELLSV
jgi:SAM-dependent methyltransferase